MTHVDSSDAGVTEGGVELSAAIEALRSALERAWVDGQNHRVRFELAPVELSMEVGVTRTGTGSAGIRWHVLSLGGERSKQAANTQTIKLQLKPVLFDDAGRRLAAGEQLVSDRDSDQAGAPPGQPAAEPE
jgi:Trypsin-co-occurring domain 2